MANKTLKSIFEIEKVIQNTTCLVLRYFFANQCRRLFLTILTCVDYMLAGNDVKRPMIYRFP